MENSFSSYQDLGSFTALYLVKSAMATTWTLREKYEAFWDYNFLKSEDDLFQVASTQICLLEIRFGYQITSQKIHKSLYILY